MKHSSPHREIRKKPIMLIYIYYIYIIQSVPPSRREREGNIYIKHTVYKATFNRKKREGTTMN